MIDEELYQQAADELNSDARRPHLWARACALASDDHDEARFLYTNLRVEELLAARKASPADASVPAADGGQVDGVELALAPLEEEPVDEPPPPHSRTGTDEHADSLFEETAFDELPDGTDEPATGERARGRPALDGPHGPPLDHGAFTEDPDPHERTLNDSPDGSLDPMSDGGAEMPIASGTPEPSRSPPQEPHEARAFEAPADPLFDATLIDEPHWLDEELVLDHPASEGTADTVDAHGAPPDRFDRHPDTAGSVGERTDATDAPGPGGGGAPTVSDKRAAGDPERGERAYRPPPSSDRTPAASTLDPAVPPFERDGDRGPIVDLDGTGPVWALYEGDDGQLKAVRRGVSWGAMLLTLPWLLWRGLPGTALVYALLWAVSLGGLLVTALAWADAGGSASPVLRGICAGFALVALSGLVVVPFLRANRWREAAWQRRGDLMRGEVRTSSAALAKRRVLDA